MSTQHPPQKLIIVGNGMVGHHVVEQLVDSGALATFEVTIFGEERHRAYDRVHLSEYFSGRDAQSLALCDADYYATNGITLRSGEAVTAIDREQQTVRTAQGAYPYDQLILATGSFPFVPPIPGNDQPGCLVYRTLDDLDAIRAAAQDATNGVVVGGGLLGLEAANALRGLNLDTAVVEFAPRLMPMQVDSEGGELLREKIEALGVQVLTERATQRIEPGDTSRLRMVFQDDKVLETDLIVLEAMLAAALAHPPRRELADMVPAICGSATLTIVVSSTSMNVPSARPTVSNASAPPFSGAGSAAGRASASGNRAWACSRRARAAGSRSRWAGPAAGRRAGPGAAGRRARAGYRTRVRGAVSS